MKWRVRGPGFERDADTRLDGLLKLADLVAFVWALSDTESRCVAAAIAVRDDGGFFAFPYGGDVFTLEPRL